MFVDVDVGIAGHMTDGEEGDTGDLSATRTGLLGLREKEKDE